MEGTREVRGICMPSIGKSPAGAHVGYIAWSICSLFAYISIAICIIL